MNGWRLGSVLLAIAWAAAACNTEASKGRDEAVAVGPSKGPATVPDTEQEFLEVLAPLAGGGVRIAYDVDGPGNLDGTLEVMARAGGFRRENWALTRPGPDGEASQIHGSTIQTPEASWSGVDGEAGVRTESRLGGLARAYLELDPDRRAAAVENLRRWHADLKQARAEHPGDVREVAGTTCLQMRVAAQDLCLWEETGLPLEYRGAEFSVVATRVEREAQVDRAAFELPDSAAQASTVSLPVAFDFDPQASIKSLVGGDYSPLAPVLTPGLRMPVPEGG